MSADAVVFATNGSGGGDTKAAAGTAMRDARKYLSNVEGTARTCTQVSVTCRGHNAHLLSGSRLTRRAFGGLLVRSTRFTRHSRKRRLSQLLRPCSPHPHHAASFTCLPASSCRSGRHGCTAGGGAWCSARDGDQWLRWGGGCNRGQRVLHSVRLYQHWCRWLLCHRLRRPCSESSDNLRNRLRSGWQNV